MIEAQGLCKTFVDKKRGTVHAVQGVSLECRPGEVFGVLGPNGAGKTTFLRMLGTILAPTSGTATVAGHDIVKDPQGVRRSIGYLSGSTAPYDRLTAREMVAYFAALNGLGPAAAARRIGEVFDELDMAGFADGRCERLSTGQRQRVNIARAIIHEPPVILFDEPTAGLDVVSSRTVMRFIRKCRAEQRTILFSTHILSEVEAVCDRIAVIHQGKVAAVGTLAELRELAGEVSLEKVFLKLIGEDEE